MLLKNAIIKNELANYLIIFSLFYIEFNFNTKVLVLIISINKKYDIF